MFIAGYIFQVSMKEIRIVPISFSSGSSLELSRDFISFHIDLVIVWDIFLNSGPNTYPWG